jgi:hypothetical protein
LKDFEEWEKKDFWKAGGTIALVIVLVAAFGFILSLVCTPAAVVSKVVNANAIISNYEWFYAMKGEIDATHAKYVIAKRAGAEEANGINMVLQSMIAEYNAKSRMVTRNLWKAKDLPYQIETEVEE